MSTYASILARSPVYEFVSAKHNSYWEAKSQQIEKMLQRMEVLLFILYIRIKGEDRKSISGRLGG